MDQQILAPARIIHIAPLIEALSERAPGGAEQVVCSLSRWQQLMGYDVAVVAATGSILPAGVRFIDAKISPGDILPIDTGRKTLSKPQGEDKALTERLRREHIAVSKVNEVLFKELHREPGRTVIHNHAFDGAFLFNLHETGACLVHTIHCPPIAYWISEELSTRKNSQASYVTVSNYCALAWEKAAGFRVGVIYNGVECEEIAFESSIGKYFLWVGRISPEKGLHTAIDTVAGVPGAALKVIGRVYDKHYFNEVIKPALKQPNIEYLGYLRRDQVFFQMRNAKALLLPLAWDEPFGLVIVEALLSGTPVVTYDRGAASEIIEHGLNGFLAKDAADFRALLSKVQTINRGACRESVVSRFSVEQMGKAYNKLYIDQLRDVGDS